MAASQRASSSVAYLPLLEHGRLPIIMYAAHDGARQVRGRSSPDPWSEWSLRFGVLPDRNWRSGDLPMQKRPAGCDSIGRPGNDLDQPHTHSGSRIAGMIHIQMSSLMEMRIVRVT
jgi:hypothetical protein